MDDHLGNIEFLQSAYTVCFGIAAAALILAVALFFLLDIREIFLIESGRARRKTVLEMNEKNQRTGKLREDTGSDNAKTGGRTVKSTQSMTTLEADQNARNGPGTVEDLRQFSGKDGGKGLKGATERVSEGKASVYKEKPGANTVLLSGQTSLAASGRFSIVRKIIITHTDEDIPA